MYHSKVINSGGSLPNTWKTRRVKIQYTNDIISTIYKGDIYQEQTNQTCFIWNNNNKQHTWNKSMPWLMIKHAWTGLVEENVSISALSCFTFQLIESMSPIYSWMPGWHLYLLLYLLSFRPRHCSKGLNLLIFLYYLFQCLKLHTVIAITVTILRFLESETALWIQFYLQIFIIYQRPRYNRNCLFCVSNSTYIHVVQKWAHEKHCFIY